MSRNFTLDRRTMLRGVGAALSLPLLEAMLPRNWARAQGLISPPRYVYMTGSVSTGPDVNPPAGYPDAPRGITVPMTTGTSYDLPRGLASLAPIRDDVTIVSNLTMPRTGQASVTMSANFPVHYTLTFTTNTGRSNVAGGGGPYFLEASSKGITADQMLIPDLAGTTIHQSLALRVDTTFTPNGVEEMSHKMSGGILVPNTAVVSPQTLFQSVFGMLVPGLTPIEEERRLLAQDIHVNIVDAVKDRAAALKAKLGKADRMRLERHLDEVRDLQIRVAATQPTISGVCAMPADPGADPTGNGNYKGELERAAAMVDMAHMALACDLTRIVCISLTTHGSTNLNSQTLSGYNNSVHNGIHHNSGNTGTDNEKWERQADCLNWHVSVYASLLAKLKGTPDGAGSLLDRTSAVFMVDNGWQPMPASNLGGSHSLDKILMIVGGRAGGLTPGKHIDSAGGHPASVLFSAIKAAGYSGATMGEMTAEFPGLKI